MNVSFIDGIKSLDFMSGANPAIFEGITTDGKFWRMSLLDGLATLSINETVVAQTREHFATQRGYFLSTTEAEMTLQELFTSYEETL